MQEIEVKCVIPTTQGLLQFGILKFPCLTGQFGPRELNAERIQDSEDCFSFPQIVWDCLLFLLLMSFFPLPPK